MNIKHALLIAGAGALGLTGSALADPGHGHGHSHGWNNDRGPIGYGMGGCPPGLAKKHNGCMPPGQAKKLYRGQRWESGYGSPYAYRQIPYDLRQQYDLSPRYRYYYENGTIYAVNPRTMLIAQVISAILH
jgi:hypothetical protein